MPHYTYIIVGGGMAASAAVGGIRKNDQENQIAIFSAEPDPPYTRPALTKGLWKGKPFETVWRKMDEKNLQLFLNHPIQSLDQANRVVHDEEGNIYSYDKLLLATGGTPQRLPFGGDNIIYYRYMYDYRQLRDLAKDSRTFTVIGGGFIGSEIAAALAMNNQKVSMVFPEEGISARLFPRDLSLFLNDYYREKGVNVHAGEMIQGFQRHGEQKALVTRSGQELVSDAIVAGIGIRPNVSIAQAAGLEVDNGVIVDRMLRTSQPDVYAAGDDANFYNPLLGVRMRVEHEDNALDQGEVAGRNMSGEEVYYDHLPYFYSDLFDLGYEAVGELNPQLETVEDWKEPFRKGIVYYLDDGRVRGVLLWNTWDQVDNARQLIAEPGPFNAENLKGRLPR